MYCDVAELPEPTAGCQEGFYCPTGSKIFNELPCTDGYYCVRATPLPEPCPNGTYGVPGASLSNINECTKCDAGHYCNGVGLTKPSGECEPGYFCPVGSNSKTMYECSKGYHCPKKSDKEVMCNKGFYQDETKQQFCKECPEGSYCESSGPVSIPKSCPPGNFCQRKVYAPEPCDAGYYNNLYNQSDSSACLPCFPGFYCSSHGSTSGEGDGPCDPGYYCTSGSTSKTQFECPVNYYCPKNTSTPLSCPSGFFTNDKINIDLTDCDPCPPGKFCVDDADGNRAMLDCSEGFICTGGSNTPVPEYSSGMGYVCPAGFFCNAGDKYENPCNEGTFQQATRASNCTICPAGFFCPEKGMNYTKICPKGQYCIKGSDFSGEPCPVGKYSNKDGLERKNQCLSCPAGR